MKNSQKGSVALVIIIILAIAAVGGGYYYSKKVPARTEISQNQTATTTDKNTKVSSDTKTTFTPNESLGDESTGLKSYTSSKIGFAFDYPVGFKSLKEYPKGNGLVLENMKVGKDMTIRAVTVATIDNLTVSYANGRLGDSYEAGITLAADIVPSTAIKKITKVGEWDAVEYEFVTATGYQWSIFQVMTDPNHYVEIAYTYGNSYRLNENGYHLTEKEWENILASFKRIPIAK